MEQALRKLRMQHHALHSEMEYCENAKRISEIKAEILLVCQEISEIVNRKDR